MDIQDLRSMYTVMMFVMFIGIVLWAWSNKRRSAFSEAANLPLNEPEQPCVDINKEAQQ